MEIQEIVIISIALAMDALGVTIGIGINSKVRKNDKLKYILSFGIFQFVFFFLGGVFGQFFEEYIVAIPTLIGGIAIGVVGIMMLKEGFKEDSNEEEKLIEKKYMPIVLGISVSIDALVIGFTTVTEVMRYKEIVFNSSLVGLITLFICIIGFVLCKYINKSEFIIKYADFLGGIILILFAIRIIFF